MILFLQYSAGGKRGGEQYTGHLHSFVKSKFEYVEPKELCARPPEFGSIIKHARASLKSVRAMRPSLIITDVSSGARNIMAVRWARRHGLTILIIVQERRTTYRYKSVFFRWLIRRLENYLIGLADIVLVNSHYIASYVAERAPRRAKIIVCHPGLEISADKIARSTASQCEPDAHLNFLAVGECTEPRKGIKYLLEALPLLSDLNLKLHLAGGFFPDAPHYGVLRDIIERNNLGGRVIFHGFLDRERLSDLYRLADIFVLPSLSEGYGMVLAEALLFGLPVVASNAAAIPEMVQDGVNALLVEPRDSQALAIAIRKLATAPDLRNRLRKANLAKANSLPTWADFDATLERELVPAIESITGLKAK